MTARLQSTAPREVVRTVDRIMHHAELRVSLRRFVAASKVAEGRLLGCHGPESERAKGLLERAREYAEALLTEAP